jgi:hypothetical protein
MCVRFLPLDLIGTAALTAFLADSVVFAVPGVLASFFTGVAIGVDFVDVLEALAAVSCA